MIMLADRLLKAAELIGTAETLADVGCDHGYLPIYLLQKGKISFAYACDVRDGPLQTAKKNIDRYGLSEKTELIKSDGLIGIREKNADVISVCGMGGRLISKIINESEQCAKKAKRLVLQPMTEIYLLRKFLSENGFKIQREVIAKEGSRFYNVMCVSEGEETNKDLFSLYFGGCLTEQGDPFLLPYLSNHYRILSAVLRAKYGREDTTETEYLTKKLDKTIKSIKLRKINKKT